MVQLFDQLFHFRSDALHDPFHAGRIGVQSICLDELGQIVGKRAVFSETREEAVQIERFVFLSQVRIDRIEGLLAGPAADPTTP